MRSLCRLVLLVFALQALVVLPADAQDTAAVAVNRRDGSSVFKLSFAVKRVMDSNVDADNAAVAYASCTDCTTVASSIQVVLVMGDADSLTTDNLAVAINYECSECETLALAYQYVFGNGEPLRFTAEGNRRLADLRRRFQALRTRDDLTLEQLAQEIAGLAAEVADVVDEELVATGQGGAPGLQSTTTTTTTAATTTSTSAVTSTTVALTSTTIAATTTTSLAPATTTTVAASSTTTTSG